MAAALLPNPLWDLVEPFLPIPPRRPQGGRPRVSDRACLTGIVFVLRSGIPWQMLPQELGCGSGMTCWRRLRDWQRAGVWDLMHFALLDWLARADQIDWSRAVVDSCSIRTLRQARRHPRSVPLARLCADLLAIAAQDAEDRLSRSAFSSSHRQVAVA